MINVDDYGFTGTGGQNLTTYTLPITVTGGLNAQPMIIVPGPQSTAGRACYI